MTATTAAYGWDHPPFHVPPEVADHLDARERGAALRARWEEAVRTHREAQPELAEEFDRRVLRGVLPEDWTQVLPAGEGSAATRTRSGAVINGMALHGGLLPDVASFLVFTDHCRPALRLASLLRARVV